MLGVRLVGRPLLTGDHRVRAVPLEWKTDIQPPRVQRDPQRAAAAYKAYLIITGIIQRLRGAEVPLWEVVGLPAADKCTADDLRFFFSHRRWYVPENAERTLAWLAPVLVMDAVRAGDQLLLEGSNISAVLGLVRTSPIAITADGVFFFSAPWIYTRQPTPSGYPRVWPALAMSRWAFGRPDIHAAALEGALYFILRYRAHVAVNWVPRSEPRSYRPSVWPKLVPHAGDRYARVSPLGGLDDTPAARELLLGLHSAIGALMDNVSPAAPTIDKDNLLLLRSAYDAGHFSVIEGAHRQHIDSTTREPGHVHGYIAQSWKTLGLAYIVLVLRGATGALVSGGRALAIISHELAHLLTRMDGGRTPHGREFALTLVEIYKSARNLGLMQATEGEFHALVHARNLDDENGDEEKLGNVLTYSANELFVWPLRVVEPNELDLQPRQHADVEQESVSDEVEIEQEGQKRAAEEETEGEKPAKRPRLAQRMCTACRCHPAFLAVGSMGYCCTRDSCALYFARHV